MSYFEKNIEVLKSRNTYLYNCIIKEVSPDTNKVFSKDAKNGEKYLNIYHNDTEYVMNSTYNPRGEGDRFAKQYNDISDTSVLLFLGFGNGIIPRCILDVGNENVHYMFYEPSMDVFLHVIKEYDVSDIISEDNCTIYVKNMNDMELETDLEFRVRYNNVNLFYIESLPKYELIYGDDMFYLSKIYMDRKNYIEADAMTMRKYGPKMVINSIYNLEYLPHGDMISRYKNKFSKDMIAVVVGAGPSLANDVDILKKMKNRVLIIAVDTVARYLLNNDIRPDLVVVADMIKGVKLFENERLLHIPLVIHTDANNAVLRKLDGTKVIYGSTENTIYREVALKYGYEMPLLPQGGSVSNLGYSIAVYLGFDKIVLLGQDLAMTGNKVHAGEKTFNPETYPRKLYKVPGNYSDEVYTTEDFLLYLKWYDMIVPYYNKITTINATSDGARIKGAVLMRLNEVYDTYCNKEYDIDSIFNAEGAFEGGHIDSVIDDLNRYKDDLNKIKRLLKEGYSLCEEALRLVTKHDVYGSKLKKISTKIDKICEEYENSAVSSMIERYGSAVELDTISDLYDGEDDNIKETMRLYEKLKGYFSGMLDSITPVLDAYKDMLDRIDARERKSVDE